jgi:threonine dehydrogenase-like Zn-dependent dehydrogenase
MTAEAQATAVLYDRNDRGNIEVIVRRVPVTHPAPGEIQVRPSFVGICGTDLEILHDRMPNTFDLNLPHTMGHEWSGTVEAVGRNVTEFSPGDLVLGHGEMGGNNWFGATQDGAAAELFNLPASMCYHVPQNIDAMTAAIIEPFACVLAGFKRVGGVTAADTVHVYGLGAIGLSAVLHSVHSGAVVVAFDPSPIRREKASLLGADAVFDPTDPDLNPELLEGVVGRPRADIVVEASGSNSARSAAIESADFGGRVLLMGLSRPTTGRARLSLILERDITVRSSIGAPIAIWPEALRYVSRAGLNLGAIVTSVVPFSDAKAALERAKDAANEIKVMLRP